MNNAGALVTTLRLGSQYPREAVLYWAQSSLWEDSRRVRMQEEMSPRTARNGRDDNVATFTDPLM